MILAPCRNLRRQPGASTQPFTGGNHRKIGASAPVPRCVRRTRPQERSVGFYVGSNAGWRKVGCANRACGPLMRGTGRGRRRNANGLRLTGLVPVRGRIVRSGSAGARRDTSPRRGTGRPALTGGLAGSSSPRHAMERAGRGEPQAKARGICLNGRTCRRRSRRACSSPSPAPCRARRAWSPGRRRPRRRS